MTKPAPTASACSSHPSRPDLLAGSFPSEQVKGGPVKTSKNGKRRAWVLIGIHVAIFLHILHWQLAGETLAPMEPSEAMFTVANGTINAGLIVMGLSTLSTLVVGRFFCGWACHLVALQDLCAWLLRRVGIRPRPLRSRWLVFVPLLAGLHLFFWPLVARWIQDLPSPELNVELTTNDMWETFPGFWVGLFTFLFCGFLMIYLLGAKGFCTYACPYGGIFGVVERFAPGRIRVTDDCKHCGHCTAVCTSNVVVHKEVHEFGKVVDPGCMKCMDCVSACPENALKFAFKDLRTNPQANKSKKAASARKPAPMYLLREEVAMFLVFAVTMVVLRGLPDVIAPWTGGLYNVMPSLFAFGVASTAAFISLYAWRLFRRTDVRWQGLALKTEGRIRPGGRNFAIFAFLFLGFLLHSAVVQVQHFRATHAIDQTGPIATAVWSQDEQALANMSPEMRGHLDVVRSAFGFVQSFGLVHDPRVGQGLTWVALADRDLDRARERLEYEVGKAPEAPNLHSQLGDVLVLQGAYDAAIDSYLRSQEHATERFGTFEIALAQGLHRTVERGLEQHAVGLSRAVLARMPEDAPALEQAAQIAQYTGFDLRELTNILEKDALPGALKGVSTFELQVVRGGLLATLKDHDAAVAAFRLALEKRPEVMLVQYSLAEQLYLSGDRKAARREVVSILDRYGPFRNALLFLAQIEQDEGNAAEASRLRELGQRAPQSPAPR